MMPPPVLAVIIPHYNDPVRLARCLDALVPQAAAQSDTEIVVVDNDSPCDLADLHRAHPAIRFVTETSKGAAAARNRGVADTTAPLLAFLDSDCVPAPDWLATARARAAQLRPGDADIVGGRIDTFDETPPPRSGAEAFEAVFAFDQRGYITRKSFSVTANLLTTRAVFDDTGPMVVGLSEDLDWCRRAVARGHRLVYDDTLRVTHPTRSDWPALMRKWRRLTDESFRSHGTGARGRATWALRALAVAASGPAHLPRVLRAPALAGAGDRRAAAGTLFRLRLVRAGWMLRQAMTGQ